MFIQDNYLGQDKNLHKINKIDKISNISMLNLNEQK